jgi:hypothetical protein
MSQTGRGISDLQSFVRRPRAPNKLLPSVLLVLVAVGVSGQNAGRYAELRRVIDRNTGFAHATRGVNMYTLYALRGCVTEKDIPVLERLLHDKDRITRMAASRVLADLGPAGQEAVLALLAETKDASERIMLQEAADDAKKPDYRPILQYPLNESELANIRGCK